VHKVLSSYDLTGGATTFIISWTMMAADKRLAQEALLAILGNADCKYTIIPQNVMRYADFMLQDGR